MFAITIVAIMVNNVKIIIINIMHILFIVVFTVGIAVVIIIIYAVVEFSMIHLHIFYCNLAIVDVREQIGKLYHMGIFFL